MACGLGWWLDYSYSMRAHWVLSVLSVLVVVLVMGARRVGRRVEICNPPAALWHERIWWWLVVVAVVVMVGVVVEAEVRAGESRPRRVAGP
jgi:hypothetical protein